MASALERMSFTERIALLDRIVISIRAIVEQSPSGAELSDFVIRIRDENGIDDETARHAMYYARAQGVIVFVSI